MHLNQRRHNKRLERTAEKRGRSAAGRWADLQGHVDMKCFLTPLVIVLSAALGLAQVPTSKRSLEVVARVRPRLQTALASHGVRIGAPIFIRIFKMERELEVWLDQGNRHLLFRKYPICTFSGELGPKLREGDRQSPEGFYAVGPAQLNPSSQFHLSVNLGYPNQYDRAHGWTGSSLMVHGNCVSIGCYAMTDSYIEEIYALADAALQNGQRDFQVHVFPFRMTSETMTRYRNSRWYSFWLELKAGYDLFEEYKRPPTVRVRDRQYLVTAP